MDLIIENLENNNMFNFNGKQLNVLTDIHDEIWFNAKEIAKLLGHKNTKKAIKNLVDDKYKKYLSNIELTKKINDHPQTIYINESGFYLFIMNSETKESEKFSQWIADTILPSIRKHSFVKLEKDKNSNRRSTEDFAKKNIDDITVE